MIRRPAALDRYGRIARSIVGPSASPEQAADEFPALRTGLGAHSLAHYGITATALAAVIADCAAAA